SDFSFDECLKQHATHRPILQASTEIGVLCLGVDLDFRKLFLKAQDLDHARISDEIECRIAFMKFEISLFYSYRGKWIHKALLYHKPLYSIRTLARSWLQRVRVRKTPQNRARKLKFRTLGAPQKRL